MRLTLRQLYDFAMSNPKKNFKINDEERWLAAQCATQLSGMKCRMDGYQYFCQGPFKKIAYSYASLCRKLFSVKEVYTGLELANEISALLRPKPSSPAV